MFPATDKKADSLQAIEFQAQVGADRTIRLPEDLAIRIAAGQSIRILVLWEKPLVEYEESTDEEWAQLSAHEMARTADDEWNDDQLLKG